MYRVEQMFAQYGHLLNLVLHAGKTGMHRPISVPEVQRPGIRLAGRLDHYTGERVLVLGLSELNYLASLDPLTVGVHFEGLLRANTPAVIVARNLTLPKVLHELCNKEGIPLFSTNMRAMDLVNKLTFYLYEALSEAITIHSTMMEIFGFGMLIQGNSSVGKSEAALGLIDRGHRLIADDVVCLRIKKGDLLKGTGPELTRHVMEIRGIGIVNVAELYRSICVRDTKRVDVIIHLEDWDPKHFYDRIGRIGLDERMRVIQGKLIPYYILPMKPSLDVALLVETIARIHRIRLQGGHASGRGIL